MLKQIPDNPPTYCNCHRNTKLDKFGDHLMTCSKSSSYWNIRHNNLVKTFSQLASSAGICNRIEPMRSLPDEDGSQKRPDLVLYQSEIHNHSNVSIDISVTHPVSNHKSATVGSSMSRRSQEKIKKYQSVCDQQGNMMFQPFIFETYGRWNDQVDIFIKKCCQLISEKTGNPYSLVKHRWTTKISSTLQNSNSYFYNRFYNMIRESNEEDCYLE
jgi:hypothetical protein